MESNTQASVTPIRESNVMPAGMRSAIARAISPHLKEGVQPAAVVANIEVELMKEGINTATNFVADKVMEFFKK